LPHGAVYWQYLNTPWRYLNTTTGTWVFKWYLNTGLQCIIHKVFFLNEYNTPNKDKYLSAGKSSINFMHRKYKNTYQHFTSSFRINSKISSEQTKLQHSIVHILSNKL